MRETFFTVSADADSFSIIFFAKGLYYSCCCYQLFMCEDRLKRWVLLLLQGLTNVVFEIDLNM